MTMGFWVLRPQESKGLDADERTRDAEGRRWIQMKDRQNAPLTRSVRSLVVSAFICVHLRPGLVTRRKCRFLAALGMTVVMLAHGSAQPRLPRIVGDEQGIGEAPVRGELIVDRLTPVRVESHRGEILQSQIAIAIDRRTFEPGCQVRACPGVRGEERDR